MASTVRVYKYDDAGAPDPPSNVKGSMAALIRACLVTGYGSKDPAGWDEVFTETNYCAVFRAREGARQFYQIYEKDTDADVAILRAFEAMDSPDTTTTTGRWYSRYFGKWHDSSHPCSTWYMVADERTCYLWLQSYNSDYMIPHAFGEFESVVKDDPYNSFATSHGNSSYMYHNQNSYNNGLCDSTNGISSSGHSSMWFHKNTTGVYTGHGNVCSIAGAYSPGGYGYSSGYAELGIGWYYIPAFVRNEYDTEFNSMKLIRGKLRGLYQPLARRPVPQNTEWIDPNTGDAFLSMHHRLNSYDGMYLVKLGSWD